MANLGFLSYSLRQLSLVSSFSELSKLFFIVILWTFSAFVMSLELTWYYLLFQSDFMLCYLFWKALFLTSIRQCSSTMSRYTWVYHQSTTFSEASTLFSPALANYCPCESRNLHFIRNYVRKLLQRNPHLSLSTFYKLFRRSKLSLMMKIIAK